MAFQVAHGERAVHVGVVARDRRAHAVPIFCAAMLRRGRLRRASIALRSEGSSPRARLDRRLARPRASAERALVSTLVQLARRTPASSTRRLGEKNPRRDVVLHITSWRYGTARVRRQQQIARGGGRRPRVRQGGWRRRWTAAATARPTVAPSYIKLSSSSSASRSASSPGVVWRHRRRRHGRQRHGGACSRGAVAREGGRRQRVDVPTQGSEGRGVSAEPAC